MIRYLITDGTAAADEDLWLASLVAWMDLGVDYIQIRERDLESRKLTELTRRVLAVTTGATRILVNDRADVALAAGAHGVHLRDGAPPIRLFKQPGFIVSASCHDPKAVDTLQEADMIILAPVFAPLSKPRDRQPIGLTGLHDACVRSIVPVIALGGITETNIQPCLATGAAGIAGISFFAR